MKSTPMRGVKQFLKPDAYKQSEGQASGIRSQGSGSEFFLISDSWFLAPA